MKSIFARLTQRRYWLPLCLLLGVIVIWISTHYAHKKPKSAAVLVHATVAKIQAMPLVITAHGSIEAQQSVSITPQVTGTITAIGFKPGERVQAGQLLFAIDPATPTANLQQAQALLERDKALLVSEEADAKRYLELVKLEYVTKQQSDQATATANAQKAVVNADEAAVKQAEIQVGYTKITAPVAGKAGDIVVHVGDLVTANATTPIATINQLDPVWVDFSIPQHQLSEVLRYKHQSKSTPDKHLTVDVYSENNQTLLGKGVLTFVDNAVKSDTGTVLLKAEIPNKEHLLWPGLMVNVELILTMEPNAIVIPMTAVQTDQDGNFVYQIVDNKAVIQRVVVDRQVKDLAVIRQGLKEHEKILTVIPPNMYEGTAVEIAPDEATSSRSL